MKKSTRNLLLFGGIVLLGVVVLTQKTAAAAPGTGAGGGFNEDPVPQLPNIDPIAPTRRAAVGRYSPYRTRASWAV